MKARLSMSTACESQIDGQCEYNDDARKGKEFKIEDFALLKVPREK